MKEFSDSDSEPPSREYNHFNRTLRALFKKNILIKIRRPISIVEFIIATVLWVVLYPCYKVARKDYSGNVDPGLYYDRVIPSSVAYSFVSNENTTFVLAPDCNNTRTFAKIFNDSMILSLAVIVSEMNRRDNSTNSTINASNATLLSNDVNYLLYDIQDKLKPEINQFVNQYSQNIIQNINSEFKSYKDIDLEDSDFNDFIKLAIIEGIFSFYHYGGDKFDFDNFIKNKIKEYFDSIITIENIYKLKKLKLDDDDNDINAKYSDIRELENPTFKDYTVRFNKKINSMLQNKKKRLMAQGKTRENAKIFAKLLNVFNFREKKAPQIKAYNWTDIINEMFPDINFNPTDFDMNQTYSLLEEYYNYDPIFVHNAKEIQSKIYDRIALGIGIYWKNAKNETDATKSPSIQTYYQSYGSNPSNSLFEITTRIISMMNGNSSKMEYDLSVDQYQSYPYVEGERLYDISILVGIIVIFPVVVASMTDLQILLEEKDNHVMILSFLMGCSETAYFMVSFIMQFLSSILAYVLMCVFFCFVFVFKGTSFTLMLVISVLFMLAHIAFLMFLATFMKKASMGRMITVLFLVIAVFFAFVHFFYTLDESNNSNVAKHIFSIIPLSCYQMSMMSMYKECRASLEPVNWHMLKNDAHVHLTYQMWFALMWLPIDFVFYFLLFLLFNLTNPRDFGSPPIRWKEIFKRKAWKRMLESKRHLGLRKKGTSVLYDTNTNLFDNQLMKVENLSKVYHGHKTVTALSDVNFTINQNEVIIVIGPNGAGKSTLINIISGALQPTTGTLKLYNNPPTESFNEIQNILGVCFQDNVIIDLLSIEENFELFGAFRNIPKDELKNKMSFFAETLQLKEMMKNRTGDLSGGQKRKVCISLSLLGNPPLVIMDEPTAGVDIQARQLIWKVIASLKNTTTIVTSHALEEAEAVSTRLFVVAGGTLPFAGTATEFRNTFKCGYILRIEAEEDVPSPPHDTVVTSVPTTPTSDIESPNNSNNDSQNSNNDKISNNEKENSKSSSKRKDKKKKKNHHKKDNDKANEEEDANDDDDDTKRRFSSHVIFLSDGDDGNDNKVNKPKARVHFLKSRKRRKKDDESSNENKIFESRYYLESSDPEDGIVDGANNSNESSISSSEQAARRVLQMIKQIEPKARMSRERVDSIRIPVSNKVPRIMNEIESHKGELKISSYSISVENLEDVLLKMIMTEEASFNRQSLL